MKQTLRPAISASLIATPGTGLTGMARVNLAHLDTSFLGFVSEEALELGKAPTMEPTLILGLLLHGGPVSDVRQVLKHDGCAWCCVLHNALGKHMIVVSALPKQFTRELTQVTFRALCIYKQLKFDCRAQIEYNTSTIKQ